MVKSENLGVFCEYVIIFITFIYFSNLSNLLSHFLICGEIAFLIWNNKRGF